MQRRGAWQVRSVEDGHSSSARDLWQVGRPIVDGAGGLRRLQAHEVAEGETVRVEGSGWPSNYDTQTAFIVSLECANGDIAYSFNARSANAGFERNSYITGAWGIPETKGDWPTSLSSSSSLKLDFTKGASKWEVSVNDARAPDLDFEDRATCGVVTATVSKNVADASVTLVPDESGLLLGYDITTWAIAGGVVLVVAVVCCILGRCSKRGSKTSAKLDSRPPAVVDEEKQGLMAWNGNHTQLSGSGGNGCPSEWLYQADDSIHGPCTNAQMLAFFQKTLIHPGTYVKLVWYQDFVPLSALYPQGNEFVDPPLIAPQQVMDLRAHLLTADGPQGEASVRYQATATDQDKPLGVSLGKVPPYPVIDVKTTEPNSFPVRHGVEVGHTILAINGVPSHHMPPEEFKVVMAQRPIEFVFEKPAGGLWGIRWYYCAGNIEVGPIDTGSMRYYFLRQLIGPATLVRASRNGTPHAVDKIFQDVAKAFASEPSPELVSADAAAAAPVQGNQEDSVPVPQNVLDPGGLSAFAPKIRALSAFKPAPDSGQTPAPDSSPPTAAVMSPGGYVNAPDLSGMDHPPAPAAPQMAQMPNPASPQLMGRPGDDSGGTAEPERTTIVQKKVAKRKARAKPAGASTGGNLQSPSGSGNLQSPPADP